MENICVMVATADSCMRLGLRTLLLSKGIAVVGEAAGPLDAIIKAMSWQPDVVVLDLSFPHGNGPVTLKELTSAAPKARLIVISDKDEEVFVEQALMHGASAYLLKETAATELCWAVSAVLRGREFFSPILISRLRGAAATVPEPDQCAGLRPLGASPMETHLMNLIDRAVLIRKMAKDLRANIKAVQQHRRRRTGAGWVAIGRQLQTPYATTG